MQHATFHIKYATYHVKHATLTSNMKAVGRLGNIPYFLLYSRHATFDVNHAIMRQTCNNLCKTCSMQHFTSNIQPMM